ncbi:hypothetical protein QBC43DRAFT_359775 [Cladorrhinum sp. PSN259]|nr:hypothetical protein QBC43DRAFT_359775 [Cladorrhinum sp. PSN259]
MERKVSFVNLDEPEEFDYRIAFEDRQEVQRLRSKFVMASAVLISAFNLGKALERVYRDDWLFWAGMSNAILQELDDYIREVEHYKRVVADLVGRCNETASLLSNILEYSNSKSTLAIARQAEMEGKLARKDSTNIKALTIVATLYLPASLLASIFSSNLVQARTDEDTELITHFVLAADFWKFLETKSDATYKKEVRVLEIVRLIKHPNILELYCSYTHDGKHNLLFPWLDSNLEDMIQTEMSKISLGFFHSAENFFIALCGLASGLECVHHFTSKSLDLSLIGCHHDLKPDNILVRDSQFVLADFGISSMKTEEQGSKTQSKGGGGFYSAPESKDIQSSTELPVGRASDVWAFGCILAVILTYLKRGPEGVKKFEEEREYQLNPDFYEYLYIFHCGPRKPNEGVSRWLDGLRVSERFSSSEMAMIDLIRDMLRLEHAQRPRMADVLSRLRLITLQRLSEIVSGSLDRIPKLYRERLAFDIERITLETWSREIEILRPPPIFDTWFVGASVNAINSHGPTCEIEFDDLCAILQQINAELRALHTSDMDPATVPVFLPLSRLTQRLLSSSPPAMRQTVRTRDEVLILAQLKPSSPGKDGDNNDDIIGQAQEEDDTDSWSHARLLQLLNMRHMKAHADSFTSQTQDIRRLRPEDVTDADPAFYQSRQDFLTFEVQRLTENDAVSGAQTHKDVLVESLSYGEDIQDEAAGRQTFGRMINIMNLPRRYDKAHLRSMQCIGFYHDRRNFGLVYDIPLPADAATNTTTTTGSYYAGGGGGSGEVRGGVVVTLAQLITLPPNKSGPPTRPQQFSLADRWLHKGLSSHNVVFVAAANTHPPPPLPPPPTIPHLQSGALRSPYLTGFAHSRPNEAGQFSNLLPDGREAELRAYLHPTYRRRGGESVGVKFLAEYEYYSLGIVLLEIGLWIPLQVILKKWSEKDMTQGEYPVRMARQLLPRTMGDRYSGAVADCLSLADDEGVMGARGRLGLSSGGGAFDDAGLLAFEEKVVCVLRGCCV